MTKADQIHRALTEMPKASDRRISRIVGCEAKEVGRLRADMKTKGEIKPIELEEDLIDDI